jgi:hypothetical protein
MSTVLGSASQVRLFLAFSSQEDLTNDLPAGDADLLAFLSVYTVSYDFAVSMGTPSSAMSNLDDFDDDLMGRNDPFLGVRVIDRSLEGELFRLQCFLLLAFAEPPIVVRILLQRSTSGLSNAFRASSER